MSVVAARLRTSFDVRNRRNRQRLIANAIGLVVLVVMIFPVYWMAATAFKPGAATILTGPEGGFTDEERVVIRSAPNCMPISLGPRILRAETAALAALAAYMTVAGDWR